MYLNKEHITKVFEVDILPAFCSFISKNYYNLEENAMRGELFTKIRRHLPELTNPSTYNLGPTNIDYIGVSKEGVITTLGFNEHYYGNKSGLKKVVEVLNSIISEINFDFEKYILDYNMTQTIYNINMYNIPIMPEHCKN